MIRAYEKDVSWQAAVWALAVHLLLLAALLLSFNWKATPPLLNVAEVELWDVLPQSEPPVPAPLAEEPPPPAVKEATPLPPEKVEAEPVKTPEVDIALEKKRQALEQKKVAEQIKKDLALAQKKQLAALQAEARKEEMQNSDKLLKQSKANETLKKLQQEALTEEKAMADQSAASAKSAASAGVLDEYRARIQAKIRGNVNKTLCATANPELKFDIALLPTGEMAGLPRLLKSSGNKACDEAVERAIMASQPLPVPMDGLAFAQFRNLKLTFRPND
ncbi:MAG: cell envelope integrity protein TolA [Methylotenera sp.]|nr:cell envelope integrity protein TolA [Methylotenera sp.]